MAQRKRRTLVAPDMNLSLDQSEGSVLSDDFLETPDDLDINVDDIETPDETDSLEFINNGNDLEWEGQTIFETFWWSVLKKDLIVMHAGIYLRSKSYYLQCLWFESFSDIMRYLPLAFQSQITAYCQIQ